MTPISSLRNAYVNARRVQPGCEHRLGCKCDPPFWLRDRTEPEKEFELRVRMTTDGIALGQT